MNQPAFRRAIACALSLHLMLAACGSEPGDGMKAAPDEPVIEARALPGDNRHVIIIPTGTGREAVTARARELCGDGDFCQVFGWTDPLLAPATFPMTDPELEAMVFRYAHNRNFGYQEQAFDCAQFGRVEGEECLTAQ